MKKYLMVLVWLCVALVTGNTWAAEPALAIADGVAQQEAAVLHVGGEDLPDAAALPGSAPGGLGHSVTATHEAGERLRTARGEHVMAMKVTDNLSDAVLPGGAAASWRSIAC